jgi:glycosyltransferase involved in cell wall biosynthesis
MSGEPSKREGHSGIVRILVLADYYLPGFKAGGALRTLAGVIDRLATRHAFSVVTRDRDLGDGAPYRGITPGSWTEVGRAEVLYLSPEMQTLRDFRRVLSTSNCAVVCCNSVFSPTFTLKPLWLRRTGRVPRVPVLVAARGQCSPAALSIKRAKKRMFLDVARGIGLYRDVTWQASSSAEEDDIRRCFGRTAKILVAPDLASLDAASVSVPRRAAKIPGRLRLVFLNRVCRIKNLKFALDLLRNIDGDVEFNIFGPMEDPVYWRECEQAARRLPPRIVARYRGEAAHGDVARILADHDLFLLPSEGENFGHAILESLLAGCPLLISDRTPWKGLEAVEAGWDVPIEDASRFRDALQRCVAMDAGTHARLSNGARAYGLARCMDESALEANARLFDIVAKGD